jgi:O-antigen ligase
MTRARAAFASFRSIPRNSLLVGILVALLAASAGIAIGFEQVSLVSVTLAGVAGLLFFLVVLKRPAIGAALILFLAPLEGSVVFLGSSGVKLASLFCIAVFAVRMLNPGQKFEFDRASVLGICFVAWAFVTMAWSPDPVGSLSDWVSFALQSILYLILVNFVLSRRDLKLVLWGHVVGGFILSVGFTQQLIALDFLRNVDIMGFGINLASRLIGLNMVLAVVLYLFEKNFFARIFLLLCAGAAGVGAVIGLSRGTWAGVAISLGVIGLVYFFKGGVRPSFGQVLQLALGALALFFILSNYVLDEHGIEKMVYRFQTGVTLSDAGGGRFEIWQVAWNVFQTSPIWGHGIGAFHDEFVMFVDQSGLANFFHVNEAKGAHNAYVLVGVELGLVGLLLLVALLVEVFRKVLRFWFEKKPDIPSLASALSLFIFLALSMTVDSAVDRKYFWYGLALVTLIVRYAPRTGSPKGPALPEEP